MNKLLIILAVLISSCGPSYQERQDRKCKKWYVYMKDGSLDSVEYVYVMDSGTLKCFRTMHGIFSLPGDDFYYVAPNEYIKVEKRK